jgi:hypothetical protein
MSDRNGKMYPCKFHHVYQQGCKHGDNCYHSHSNEDGDQPCDNQFCVANGKQFTHMKKNHGKSKKKPSEDAPAAAPAPQPEAQPPTKDDLLNAVYEKIAKKVAGKVTGMFGEGFDIAELQAILDDPAAFDENLKLAYEVLLNHSKSS